MDMFLELVGAVVVVRWCCREMRQLARFGAARGYWPWRHFRKYI